MPTIITHIAPVLAGRLALTRQAFPARLFWLALFCSVLPDFDVIGFRFGVEYDSLLGHRGLSHSLLFAALCGGLAALAAPALRCCRGLAAGVIFMAVASHILLDALTSGGGLGVMAFWPCSEGRFFFPWRPIQVSPLNPSVFFDQDGTLSAKGLAVVLSELRWVWLPCFSLALVSLFLRFLKRSR